jgi:hypothetical protein
MMMRICGPIHGALIFQKIQSHAFWEMQLDMGVIRTNMRKTHKPSSTSASIEQFTVNRQALAVASPLFEWNASRPRNTMTIQKKMKMEERDMSDLGVAREGRLIERRRVARFTTFCNPRRH